jgi:hypothetical protein
MPDPVEKNEPLQARIVLFTADLCLPRLRILKTWHLGFLDSGIYRLFPLITSVKLPVICHPSYTNRIH